MIVFSLPVDDFGCAEHSDTRCLERVITQLIVPTDGRSDSYGLCIHRICHIFEAN